MLPITFCPDPVELFGDDSTVETNPINADVEIETDALNLGTDSCSTEMAKEKQPLNCAPG